MDRTRTAQQVAARFGKSPEAVVETLRRFERSGLLLHRGTGRPRVPANYSEADTLRAAALLALREQGFSVHELKCLIASIGAEVTDELLLADERGRT